MKILVVISLLLVGASSEQIFLQTENNKVEIISSDENLVVDDARHAVICLKAPFWDINFQGASWVWSSYKPESLPVQETHSFSRSFFVTGKLSSLTLKVAADDLFWVTINGKDAKCSSSTPSYTINTLVYCTIFNYIYLGMNEIRFYVTNKPTKVSEPNYAGLIFQFELYYL